MRKLIFIFAIIIPATLLSQPSMGVMAPEISLKDASGNTQLLSAYKGKVVLIDFWASWCLPCRQSNRDLVKIYDLYKSKGFEIFGISLDEKADDWKNAVAKDKINWKQVTEPGGWDAPVAIAWKIEKLPSSYLLDREGKIIAIDPSKNQLIALLKKQLQ
jgi:thiol-disulfide isomerase/thioredoxin